MLDLVLVDGRARGLVCRNLMTGALERHAAHAVVLATGGCNVYFLSTNAGTTTSPQPGAAPSAARCSPTRRRADPPPASVSGEHQSKLTL
jgi:succinate dehydrogenase / fumarate reductase flavoprotein subunit